IQGRESRRPADRAAEQVRADRQPENRQGDRHYRSDIAACPSRQSHPVRRAAFFLGLALAALAHAQPYPTKPIHIVVPSPPGGPPDLIIRMLAPKMNLGQPLVIENRAGAGGIVGTAYVAKTPADGYTWLFTTASHVN